MDEDEDFAMLQQTETSVESEQQDDDINPTIAGPDMSHLCCVCLRETSNAHRCNKCNKSVHAICGDHPDGEEGYGAGVICRNCQDKDVSASAASNMEPPFGAEKRKGTDVTEPWWLKPKVMKTPVVKAKKADPKQSWGICVTCFREGEDESTFKLCRRDSSTIKRHTERRHANTKKEVIIKPYYDKDDKVVEAREAISKSERKNQEAAAKKTSTDIERSKGIKDNYQKKRLTATETQPKASEVEREAQNSGPRVAKTTGLARIFSEQETQNQSYQLSDEATLHNKMDLLINEFRDFKLQSKMRQTSNVSAPLAAVDTGHSQQVAAMLSKWADIKNIIDLVNECSSIRYFAGEEGENTTAVLRCETCYAYLLSKRPSTATKQSATTVAKRGIGGFSGSLATGLLYEPDKAALLVEGGNQYFYKLKNSVKNHITLVGGQLHFEALQFEKEHQKRSRRANHVTENLVTIALTLVKTKTAAIHYETLVASYASTGADVGDLSHGRKQFPSILRCAQAWLDNEVEQYLCKPLPSTNLPPHFYVTTDKSTPNRITNQAVMICLMVDGVRTAIAVNAPEVYHESDSGIAGDVTGSLAHELAESLIHEIKTAYPSISDSMLQSSWMGTVCDGAYQAAAFAETLASWLDTDNEDMFFDVIWDSPHFIDLAVKDVFSGKVGFSRKYVSRLCDRVGILHAIFNRGKMLSHAKQLAKTSDEFVCKLTSRASSTRFSTSQYVEFKKLLDSLPLYIESYREFKPGELKEYQIAGDDFVADILAICDVLKPFIELLVQLQGLSVPCWKVVTWWKNLKASFDDEENTLNFSNINDNFPLIKEHLPSVANKNFKGIQLTEGWRIINTETQDENGSDRMATVDHWEKRELSDCETDAQQLFESLQESCDERIDRCAPEMANVLTCLDLDNMIACMCGERSTTAKVGLVSEGALARYGSKQFKKFYAHVCSLKHVKQLACDMEEETFFDSEFATPVLHRLKQAIKGHLWSKENQEVSTWFGIEAKEQLGFLVKFKQIKSPGFSIENCYELSFQNSKENFMSILDEKIVYKAIYTNQQLYSAIGIEGCISIDIALAKGGTESIVESYYSVMNSQKMSGGQNNDTLALRTKLDWCLPGIPHLRNRAVKEIARFYLLGDKERGLTKHAVPILGDRAKFRNESKVMKRQRTEDARLPFLY